MIRCVECLANLEGFNYGDAVFGINFFTIPLVLSAIIIHSFGSRERSVRRLRQRDGRNKSTCPQFGNLRRLVLTSAIILAAVSLRFVIPLLAGVAAEGPDWLSGILHAAAISVTILLAPLIVLAYVAVVLATLLWPTLAILVAYLLWRRFFRPKAQRIPKRPLPDRSQRRAVGNKADQEQ